jgi:hypothetical protein
MPATPDFRPNQPEREKPNVATGGASSTRQLPRFSSLLEPLNLWTRISPSATVTPQSMHGPESDCTKETSSEPSEAPTSPRFDLSGRSESLKLEKRGVTPQLSFWSEHVIQAESIVAKLREAGRFDLSDPLAACHTHKSMLECTACHKAKPFYNRCELGHCPLCQPRLSRERKKSIEWWTHHVSQPKHVVLTVRNSATFTKAYVQSFKAAWNKLRRSALAANWTAGFYSLEVTNEGKGWHLHLHALIDARWIDAKALAIKWAKLTGQDFAIVKVKDVRQADYLSEVTKYAVKGSQLASWSPSDIAAYIDAMNGVRTFGVFGALYGLRTKWRDFLDTLQKEMPACECGCSTYYVLTEAEYAWKQQTGQYPTRCRSG